MIRGTDRLAVGHARNQLQILRMSEQVGGKVLKRQSVEFIRFLDREFDFILRGFTTIIDVFLSNKPS
jgi:hypothetical protein